MASESHGNWTLKDVDQRTAAIKTFLDENTGGPRDRADLALAELDRLTPHLDSSPAKRLDAYIYLVSALVCQAQDQKLSDADINRLFEDALNILKLQDIDAKRSKLAFLYGELQLVMSHIHKFQGHLLLSAWEQLLASRFMRGSNYGAGSISLSAGQRALSLSQGRRGQLGS